MKKILTLILLVLIIATSQMLSSFQMKNADKITDEQVQLAVKAHNIEHWCGD